VAESDAREKRRRAANRRMRNVKAHGERIERTIVVAAKGSPDVICFAVNPR